MRRLFLIPVIVCFLLNCATVGVNKSNYQGKPKHAQPAKSVLPDGDLYNPEQSLSFGTQSKMESRIKTLAELQGITGITAAAFVPGEGLGYFQTGLLSKKEKTPVDSKTVFYWASVGKLVTSVVIHQLASENKLKLDDKLVNWFPQIQDASKISLEHLLNHTSGLYSFNSDPAFQSSNDYRSPDELLEIVQAQKNLFPAGQQWSYSNSGYLLLALIAEKIEGKPFHQIVHERIAEPLNLKTLRVLDPEENPDNLACGHKSRKTICKDRSIPLGAGNLVGNAKDMAILLSAVLSGKLLPQKTVYAMLKDLYPMFDNGMYYGRGMMLYDFFEINKTDNVWIGHSGGTEEYKAILAFDTKTKMIVAVSVNENKPAEAVAFDLVKSLSYKNTFRISGE